MNIEQYLTALNTRYITGIASEHSYRADLEALVKQLINGIEVTNEPSQVTDCGNPDYVITRKNIPIGYIEAKDIGKNLNAKAYVEQFTRYKNALDNLIITDYIYFQFFENGELMAQIQIADIKNGKIVAIPEHFEKFTNLMADFANRITQAIKSPAKLAELMAGKARLLQNILKEALDADIKQGSDTELIQQLSTFRTMLIHDLQPQDFADLYAQTLAYGMFASRYHDKTLNDFDRDEAARLIPKSNPLLRHLFQSIAGYDIDKRIRPTVDNLAEIFSHADVKSILSGYGKSTQQTDPIVHFYETFLSKYDAKLRKARGVWYTPAPVVKFIVRAVDDILKTKFNLTDGLADTSKTTVEVEMQGTSVTKGRHQGNAIFAKQQVHKVQILDPATGTGTFLAEVVQHLYDTRFKNMQGAWASYVENHLIPRLNGFELLMASYAMAHLKLDMLLSETGCNAKRENRFRIFLTNSLEEYHPDTNTLFSTWLSNESKEANTVKKDTPVMVVMGNPPYAVSSSNKGKWIQNLLRDYKKNLNERKINLDDDYIKFIRYGQHFIDNNGEGILAYISNNSFIDGITHRQMRKSLLESFDEIYILDLHGNSKKKEKCPDGSKDENVFDIMQGVSINIFIKKKIDSKKLADVYHYDLYGKRDFKYNFLERSSIEKIEWNKLEYSNPNYFFVYKDFSAIEDYAKGIKLNNLFQINSSGIETQRDKLAVKIDKSELVDVCKDFIELNEIEIKNKYKVKDGRDWTVLNAKNDILFNGLKKISKIYYRPFDKRYSYLSGTTKGFVAYSRYSISKHFSEDNYALLTCKRQTTFNFQHILISDVPSERCAVSLQTGEVGYMFPLYLYPDDGTQRIPNLNTDEIKLFAQSLNLPFVAEKQNDQQSFAPIDILDYIYAVLHSPNYRQKYQEFLKIDFPRVPYPTIKTFWQLAAIGAQIRSLHLMESELLNDLDTTYPQSGDNIITRKLTKTNIGYQPTTTKQGKVWINDTQYFDNVPLLAWEFYIGGYQPAQKWLKDRHNTELSFTDILHYQKIIKSLTQTHHLMHTIDNTLKL